MCDSTGILQAAEGFGAKTPADLTRLTPGASTSGRLALQSERALRAEIVTAETGALKQECPALPLAVLPAAQQNDDLRFVGHLPTPRNFGCFGKTGVFQQAQAFTLIGI
jgi:hypothetical protein